jgi:hypothetical protein
MSKNIITDGYTRHGYIAVADGLHSGLRFQYRPMLPEEAAVFVGETFERMAPKKRYALAAAAIADKVKEWDEQDEAGKPLPVTQENVRRLPWHLFNRLLNVVCGFGSNDAENVGEAADAGEQDEYLGRLLKAVETGEPIGVVCERADRKN